MSNELLSYEMRWAILGSSVDYPDGFVTGFVWYGSFYPMEDILAEAGPLSPSEYDLPRLIWNGRAGKAWERDIELHIAREMMEHDFSRFQPPDIPF